MFQVKRKCVSSIGYLQLKNGFGIRSPASTLSDKEHKIIRKIQSSRKKAAAIKTTEAANIKWGAGISSLDAEKRSSKPEGSSNLKDTCQKPFRMEKEKLMPDVQELGWERLWESSQSSTPLTDFEAQRIPKSQVFTMLLPPPNVTGELHMGHALDVSIQDTCARFQNKMGNHVVWIPGCDHAGIATQVVAERILKASSEQDVADRESMGREHFVDFVKQSIEDYSVSKIQSQLKRLGACVDWNWYTYTMSENYSKAVTEAFCVLFNEGLIYRKTDLNRWSPTLRSVVSDSEIDMREITAGSNTFTENGATIVSDMFGLMFFVEYDIIDGEEGEKIVAATTRPETMFGDVALAVNPRDFRYNHLIGRSVINPVNGDILPIKAEETINPELGTGAMKLTPCHNPYDKVICYKFGYTDDVVKSHCIYDKKCLLVAPNELGVSGLNRYQCREAVVKFLDECGKIVKREKRQSFLPFCARSGDLLEFIPMDQWFLDAQSLIDKVRPLEHEVQCKDQSGMLRHAFQSYTENWCISRQIWWGHRVPAYQVSIDGKRQGFVAARNSEEALSEASLTYNCHPDDVSLKQDTDVLDTWFSSALYPLASIGWPDVSVERLGNLGLYPSSLLVTGRDIVRPWVSRMLMVCSHLAGNVLPFKSVYFHGLMLDPFGRKMSKSKGNVIDPMDIINGLSYANMQSKIQNRRATGKMEKFELDYCERMSKALFPAGTSIPACGADSLKLMLLKDNNKSAEDFRFHMTSAKFALEFCNKLRNVASFTFKYAGNPKYSSLPVFETPDDYFPSSITLVDEIFLKRLVKLQSTCIDCYETMNFTQLINELTKFLRKDFSGFYLFYVYVAIEDPELAESAYCTLVFALSQFLKLSHPVIPFLTEKLYQQLRYGTAYHRTDNQTLFELESLNGERFLNLQDLENCYQLEIGSSDIPNDAYLEQLLSIAEALCDMFLDCDVVFELRNSKSSLGRRRIYLQAPNSALVTSSLQAYFKRIVEMKILNSEVLYVDDLVKRVPFGRNVMEVDVKGVPFKIVTDDR